MAWTTEMIDGLKQMWKKGLTTNEIAKELGVSKNSIVGKVHRLNLTARPSPIKKKDGEDEINDIEIQKNEPVTKEPIVKEKSKVLKTSKIEINTIEVKAHKNTCIKLSELDSHTCRWPIGDPKDEGFCFCGRKVKAGQTYCEEHAAIAYVKPGKKEK
ncbi:MAG: global cell cycle regulator GcrA-like protein [Alphaproteobacteria bacterium]|nr:global cell cycle regulator GcrA-like protein [Alphaproteobacteria bacterium]